MVERDRIEVKAILYSGMASENIGYIRLARFSDGCSNELRAAIKNLKNKSMKSLILDLRDNPGGLLLESIKISSFFLPDRALRSTEFLGVHLGVSAVFLALGVLVFGIQRHVAGIAALAARGHDAETAQELAVQLNRLLAYLLAGGAFLCAVLAAMTYGILERIDQGFAVFG